MNYDHGNPGPEVFSCPRPCSQKIVSDQSGAFPSRLSGMVCSCKDPKFDHVGITSHDPNARPPSLLRRLLQAAVLLDKAITGPFDSPLDDESMVSNEIHTFEVAVNELVGIMVGDRDRGAEVNCSVLGYVLGEL